MWAAVAFAMAAVALALPVRSRMPGQQPAIGREGRSRVVPVLVSGALLGGVVVLLSGTTMVLAAIGVLTAGGVWRIAAGRRRARAADRRSERVLAVCESMAAELNAGQPPLQVLDRCASEWDEFSPVAVAGRLGADVPDALRRLAASPGGDELRVVAAAWQVAHRSGAGLATAITQVAGTIRHHRSTQRLVGSELAAAWATSHLMAVLPAGVLMIGAGVGGDPVGFLTETAGGLGCLACGLLLSFLGMIWLQRIADGVLR